MRKLAGILAFSLFLELLSPMQTVYAQNGNGVSETITYDENVVESEDSSKIEVMTETEELSVEYEEESFSEANTEETSVEEAFLEVLTTEETVVETTSEETTKEQWEQEIATENQTEEDTTECIAEEMTTVQELELEKDALLATEATDVSNQAKMYLQEKYYFFKDKGYPLSAAFVLPEELLGKDLTFTEIALSIDGEEPQKLQAEGKYVSYYSWDDNDYGYCSFYAGYNGTIDQGNHELTYTVTFTLDGSTYYVMEATAEAEFVKDEGTEKVYYEIEGTEFWDYIPTKKGTEISRICTSYVDYKSETEKVINVQLRNHATGELVKTTLADLVIEESDSQKHDSRYKMAYDEMHDLYTWTIMPNEYYYRWGRAQLVLEQDIEEGLYDLILTTDAGYTHIYDSYYKATNEPVLYGVNNTKYTEASDLLVYADDSGEYVSAFVYGFNLTEANIPVFYDDSYSTILTEYDESDPYCHLEKQKYGINITVKKKDKLHSAWDVSTSEYKYKAIKVKVPNVELYRWGSENEVTVPYYAQMVYRQEKIIKGNFTVPSGIRFYFSPEYVENGDTITVEGYKSIPGSVGVELSETYEVLSNGLEYYIHIPQKSGFYENVYLYEVTNDRTGEKQDLRYYDNYELDMQQSNILVPGNCTWEIHSAKDVGNILYSGKTTEETEVLTPEQIIDLSKYGNLRVCIYDEEGNIVDRYFTFLECSEYYTVDYVLNDDDKDPACLTENEGYYFKDKGLVLATPVRENYTFMGWYSDAKLTKKVTKIAVGSKGNKTFYAKWIPDVYSIVYDANGGTGKIKTTTWKYKESASVAVNIFARNGYTFSGWNTKKDGSGTSYEEKQVLTGIWENEKKTITLYAIWEPITYTLLLDKNSGNATDGTISGSPARIEMVYGETITLNGDEYEWLGHTIKSWNTKPNGKGKKYNLGEVGNLSKNRDDIVMLYAQWDLEKYSITYDYKGGKVSSKNPLSYTCESKDIVLKEPKKAGYIFDGYYECDPEAEGFSENTEKISVIKAGTTGNKKLYAKWIPITYTVILNKNSEQASYGTVANEQGAIKECVYDELNPYVLIGDEYVWEGKEIAAWTTKPNGKGKKYKNGAALKNLTKNNTESIVLYAQWETEKYAIEYIGVDGIKHKNPNSYTYDEAKKITLKNVAKKGYIFGGWYEGNTETEANRITHIDRSQKKDIVICAKWTPITYTVCLKPNAQDASVKPGLSQVFTVKYDEPFELGADSYTRKHYKIAYFSKNSKGSGTKYQSGELANLTTKNGSLITLYPKWELEKYPVIYENTEFENVKNTNPQTYTYGKEVKLKNPSRTGYIFGGWYLEDTTTAFFDPQNAAAVKTIPKGSEGEYKIYAYWKPLTYYVQLVSNAKDAQSGSVLIGSSMEKKEITAGESMTFAVDAYKRVGYTLTGFSEKKNGKGKCYHLGEEQYVYGKKEGCTVKLYAVWEKVAPPKVMDLCLSVENDDLCISFSSSEEAGYYEINYSETISMRNAERIIVNDGKKQPITISSLTSGKRYYVRVREVQVDSCDNKIYGSWSRTVSIVK